MLYDWDTPAYKNNASETNESARRIDLNVRHEQSPSEIVHALETHLRKDMSEYIKIFGEDSLRILVETTIINNKGK